MDTVYFKVEKNTSYGEAFQALIDQGNKIQSEIYAFMIELGADPKYLMNDCYVFGTGVCGAKFLEEPDPKIWKKISRFAEYYQPRINSKIGKELQARFDSFEQISQDEIGKVFGWDNFFSRPGFSSGEEFFGVAMDASWKHPMPKEFIEITFTEYQKL